LIFKVVTLFRGCFGFTSCSFCSLHFINAYKKKQINIFNLIKQNEAKRILLEKKEALRREKEERKKSKRKCNKSYVESAEGNEHDEECEDGDDDDNEDVKRRKLIANAEAIAAAQVAKWDEEDALVDRLLDDNDAALREYEEEGDENDDYDGGGGGGGNGGNAASDEDVISRVPSLAEEKAECELLSKVLAGFNEQDHMLLETMVTKARYVWGREGVTVCVCVCVGNILCN
jgi:hypothetical protein